MRVKNLYIGNKAKNLLFLRENGFQVPDFRIITPEQVLEIATHPEMSEAIIHGVLGDFAP